MNSLPLEQQITTAHHGHILTNAAIWSPDSAWIVYDTRSDPVGERFDGDRIEIVNVETGEVRRLYESRNGAHCGVATFSPVAGQVVFILGPENPTPDWQYGPCHRQGVLVDVAVPGVAVNLDARNLTPPFTPGALRGGSHLHLFSEDGQWVSFTYEDHLLSAFRTETEEQHVNLRNVGVSVPLGPVQVKKAHPRNHDGEYFSVLVTRTTANPRRGSNEISRACEEAWVGASGYAKANGTHQRRALAFQGHVATERGETISEVFIVDLPDDLTICGDGPLAGTERLRPFPPSGVEQRRLTFTSERKHPGLQGQRHWLRSSPDGSQIAFLMKDERGQVQLWTVSPNGGAPVQVTDNPWDIGSAFTWSPDGRTMAHVMDGSVAITDSKTGLTTRLTARANGGCAPRPEACVFSPDGKKIAFVRRVESGASELNQLCAVRV